MCSYLKYFPVQVELLTPSHRHLLLSEPPLPQLDPSACEERIISHEVKELGEHRSASSPLSSPVYEYVVCKLSVSCYFAWTISLL